MILEAEPVDIYAANPTTHSKHTNTVTKLLHLWLGLHITQQFVLARHTRHQPPTVCVGVALLLVLQLYPPSLPIPLRYTKQSQIKHRLT